MFTTKLVPYNAETINGRVYKLVHRYQRYTYRVLQTIQMKLILLFVWAEQVHLGSAKGQIISKGLLVSSNSPKERLNEFVFTTTTILFIHFLGEFKDTKRSF